MIISKSNIQYKRLNNDTYGNPRYELQLYYYDEKIVRAVSKQIGGKVYNKNPHAIVVQSYNIDDLTDKTALLLLDAYIAENWEKVKDPETHFISDFKIKAKAFLKQIGMSKKKAYEQGLTFQTTSFALPEAVISKINTLGYHYQPDYTGTAFVRKFYF